MPRTRTIDEADIKANSGTSTALEEDYLDVDKALPGQNFYCISFVSPDKVLARKDMWMFHHYTRNNIGKMRQLFNGKLDAIISSCDDGTVDISDIISLKKSLEETCVKETCAFEEFTEKFEDFTFADEEKLNESFDKANNFQTSIRGVKVRGVFDSKREADVRSAVLQRQDPSFDVFVGQIGYWCPWNPNPQKIADVEYLNNDLNRLVKEYKANEVKKDMFYNEQKVSRQKDAHTLSAEDRLKHKEGLVQTQVEKDEMEKQISASGNVVVPNTNNPVGIIKQDDIGSVQDMINMSDMDVTTIPTTGDATTGDAATGDATTGDAATGDSITYLDIGGKESKVVSFETTAQALMADDPWLQRKMEEKNSTQ